MFFRLRDYSIFIGGAGGYSPGLTTNRCIHTINNEAIFRSLPENTEYVRMLKHVAIKLVAGSFVCERVAVCTI